MSEHCYLQCKPEIDFKGPVIGFGRGEMRAKKRNWCMSTYQDGIALIPCQRHWNHMKCREGNLCCDEQEELLMKGTPWQQGKLRMMHHPKRWRRKENQPGKGGGGDGE